MPTYRSITLSLISQYDILTIPEYAPPKTAVDPFSNAPTLISPDNSLVSVYIPTYPSSQFWLSYSISPPHPPNLLYYFKLYINRQHVVSWGCGHDDGYKGKTMFGLYDSGHGTPLSPGLERRVLCFTSDLENGRMPDTLSDVMEIKVFRSKGRKRVRPTVQEFTAPASKVRNLKNSLRQPSSAGIELLNGGLLSRKNPQRFYQYALLDPLDQPFATFRYYYRTWDQLEALGVVSRTSSLNSSSIRSIIPSQQQKPSPRSSTDSLPSPAFNGSPEEGAALSPIVNTPLGPTIYDTKDSSNEESPQSSEDDTKQSSDIFPLSEPVSKPIRFIRPPTPPLETSPLKIRLPALPPTSSLLSTNHSKEDADPNSPAPQTEPSTSPLLPPSKETFASLVRNLPSHDSSAFKLNETIQYVKAGDLHARSQGNSSSRSGSMHALRKVVESAKGRRMRKGSGAEDAATASDSEGERERKGSGSGSDGGNGDAPHGRDKMGKPLSFWDAV